MLRRRQALITAGLALGAVAGLTGCATHPAASPAQGDVRPPPIPLAVGESVPGLSWATVRTGGPSVGGKFWQLLVQDRSGGRWRLATPPGVADNGGLAVARADGGTITAGFVPSQLLTFTPLAVTADAGAHWSQGLLPAAIVPGPQGLAALPGGRLVAVTVTSVRESASGTTGWTQLTTLRALAATPAGRRCGLVSLTGAVAEPDGTVLVAGRCQRPGATGLFAATPSGWQRAGPVLPGSLGLTSASIVGLISTKAGTALLLAGRTSQGEVLIPAWLPAGSSSWSTYSPMRLSGTSVESVSASASGIWAVTLSGRRGLITASPAAATWRGRFRFPLTTRLSCLVPLTATSPRSYLVVTR